jgi:hypothetical protein
VGFQVQKKLYEKKKVADELGVNVGELAREVLRKKLEEIVEKKTGARPRGVKSTWGVPLVITTLMNREDLLIAVLRFLKDTNPEFLERALKRAGVVSEEWRLGGEGEGEDEEA